MRERISPVTVFAVIGIIAAIALPATPAVWVIASAYAVGVAVLAVKAFRTRSARVNP